MEKKDKYRILLLGAVSLALAACSSAELFDVPHTEPNSTPAKGETAQISISVRSASLNGIVAGGAQTRIDADKIAGTTEESAIHSLDIYLFEPDGSGTADENYRFYQKFSISESELQTADGNLTCNLSVDATKIGTTMKFALIANDSQPEPTPVAGATSLATFRGAFASAVAADGDAADVLVGGSTMNFPMTAITDATTLTERTAVTARLVRNVARVDICNYAKNLTITSVTVGRANNRSCLFVENDDEINLPAAGKLSPVTLSPLSSYATLLNTDGGIGYTTPANGSSAEADIKEANTKPVFYLYEQSVSSDATSPVIAIDYTIDKGTSKTRTGTVYVYFKNSAGTYVNVVRNTRYLLTLGNGQTIDTDANTDATLTVEGDWSNSSTSFSVDNTELLVGLTPTDDGQVKVGWFMLADGSLVYPGTHYTYIDDKKKPIGVVAYMFDDESRAKLSATTTSLLAKSGGKATGLVLALKNAGTGQTWKNENTDDQNAGCPSSLSAAYTTATAYDGYVLTKIIMDEGGDDFATAYPAFQAIKDFRSSTPAPQAELTTDWFMPSIGEWMDMLGLAGIGKSKHVENNIKTCDNSSNSAPTSDEYKDAAEVLERINNALAPAGTDGTDYDKFRNNEENNWFQSSTESNVTGRSYMVNFSVLAYFSFLDHPKIYTSQYDNRYFRTRCVLIF